MEQREEKPLRIWVVNQYAVPTNIAGITRHFELSREWAEKEEAEVTLFCSRFLHPRRTFLTEEEKKEIPSVPGLRLEWLWSFPHQVNDFRRIINMLSFTLNFFWQGLWKRKPDVMVASSPHIFAAFAGLILAKIKRVPFVFEVRDLWPDSLIKMGGLNNKLLVRILTWMESFLYRHSDQIVVLTEHQRKYIAARGIPEEKIELIPNGVVLGSWKHSPEKDKQIREKMGVSENEFVAIYTGAHGPANALEHVVRAGKYLPEGVTIVLIGDGPEKERLLAIQKEEGIDRVRLLDPVPKSEIFDYTAAANCGIISLADNEVFRGARPNKLFDYLFVGQPIVTNVDGEVREIVEKNKVGLFAGAENPEGLAQAILQVRNYSQQELKEIKERGLRYIDEEGNRVKLAHKFYQLIEKIGKRRK